MPLVHDNEGAAEAALIRCGQVVESLLIDAKLVGSTEAHLTDLAMARRYIEAEAKLIRERRHEFRIDPAIIKNVNCDPLGINGRADEIQTNNQKVK